MSIGSNWSVPSPRNPRQLLTTIWFPQLSDVANGLVYMHGQEMIHGDLKGVRVVKLNPISPPR